MIFFGFQDLHKKVHSYYSFWVGRKHWYLLTGEDHVLCTFAGVLLTSLEAGFMIGLLPDWDCRWVCSIIWWIKSSCCLVSPSLLPEPLWKSKLVTSNLVRPVPIEGAHPLRKTYCFQGIPGQIKLGEYGKNAEMLKWLFITFAFFVRRVGKRSLIQFNLPPVIPFRLNQHLPAFQEIAIVEEMINFRFFLSFTENVKLFVH